MTIVNVKNVNVNYMSFQLLTVLVNSFWVSVVTHACLAVTELPGRSDQWYGGIGVTVLPTNQRQLLALDYPGGDTEKWENRKTNSRLSLIVVTSLLSHNLIPDTLCFFRCVFWVGHCMGGANLLYFSAFMIYPEQSPNNISKNIPPCFHDTCSHLFGLLMSFFFFFSTVN